MIEFHRILVPTDFGACSELALGHGLDLGRQFGASVLVLHVVPRADEFGLYTEGMEGWATMEQRTIEAARRHLADELRRLASPVAPEGRVASGKPHVEIVRVADEDGCDLVVMGTHGRTGVAHLVLGSVTERVLRHAPCPVLVVRPTPAK